MVVGSYAVVWNNTEKHCVPFIYSPLKVTWCKSVDNRGMDSNATETPRIPSPKDLSRWPLIATLLPLNGLLGTNTFPSILAVLSSQVCHISGWRAVRRSGTVFPPAAWGRVVWVAERCSLRFLGSILWSRIVVVPPMKDICIVSSSFFYRYYCCEHSCAGSGVDGSFLFHGVNAKSAVAGEHV